MTKRKSFMTVILSLIATLCIVFGGMGLINNATTAKAETPEDYLTSFKMVEGVLVRTAEPYGMRFTTQISAEEYNELMGKVESGDYDSVVFGTLIIPTDLIGHEELTVDTPEVKNAKRTTWDANYNPDKKSDVYYYNGDLIGIQDDNFARDFTALGYCAITINGQEDVYYAKVEEGDNQRNIFAVANTLVQQGGDYENNSFLLGIIDTVMETKSLELNLSSVSAYWKQEKELPLVAKVNGKEVAVDYTVEDEGVATYENGVIKGVGLGETKIIATLKGGSKDYTAEVTVDVSVDVASIEQQFANKTSRTVTDIYGNYHFTQHAYYEKGIGVWMYGVATHPGNGNVEGFSPTVGNVTAKVYMGNKPLENFDENQTYIWAEELENDVYKTSFVGLVPQSELTESTDWLAITPVFDNSANGNIWIHEQTDGERSWWGMSQSLIDENGWFETKGKEVDLEFTEAYKQYGFTWSATLNKYGLFVKAEVKTDNEAKLRLEITKGFAETVNELVDERSDLAAVTTISYTKTVSGVTPTWNVMAKYTPALDTFGYKHRITYEFFYSYEQLGELGVKEFYKGDGDFVDIDSTLYLNATVFDSTYALWSNWLDYRDAEPVIKENNGPTWRHSMSQNTGVTERELMYYRKSITKDGMTN